MTAALPGPRGLPVVGSLLDVARDPLGFVTRVRDRYGDVARIDLAGVPFVLLCSPADIDIVLRERSKDFGKGALGAEKRRLFGKGLATSDGELWRRQRQLAQPAFHRDRIADYAAVVGELAREAIERAPPTPLDLHAELMRLTLRVVGKLLFGADIARGDASAVAGALGDVLPYFTRQSSFFLRLAPRPLRRLARIRFERAVDRLDRVIAAIIADRRRDPADHRDLLAMLMAARDADGAPMSDHQLRDEVMTAFLAGHETTALALSWTFALLARHPDVDRLVADELRAAPALTWPAVSALPMLGAVLKESMRLYPPAWILVRQAQRPVDLASCRIDAGAHVAICAWSVHRDPRWFAQPAEFRPERWLGDLEARLPRFAYFPFGGGPRGCIGSGLATMEATLVLATFLSRARFALEPDRMVDPEASISLRPRGGVRGRLSPRFTRSDRRSPPAPSPSSPA